MSTILPFDGKQPRIAESVFVAETAAVIGDVAIGPESSIWYGAVLRGDVLGIRVGARTSIQDSSVLHTSTDWTQTVIGDEVTVGHAVILHGCHVSDRVVIGMGSILMDEVIIGEDVIIGAGSLLPPKTSVPSGVLALGRPAKVKRRLTDAERASIREGARTYVEKTRKYLAARSGR